MKNFRISHFFILLAIAVCFSNCSVQKRSYRNGYFISWNKKNSSVKQNISPSHKLKPVEQEETVREVVINSESAEEALASSEKTGPAQVLFSKKKSYTFLADTCGDLITLRNGDEIKGKVIEVSDKAVKYKRCDNMDGPLIVVSADNVFMIKYSNGTKEVFRKVSTPTPSVNEKPTEPEYNSLAIASFVVSLFSWLIIPAPVALILGAMAVNEINRKPLKYVNRWMAIFGIVIGTIGTILLLIFLIALVMVI